jgi:predicted RND superfamily exporter protein
LLQDGFPLDEAYRTTLRVTGKAVIFTGLTLTGGVGTWIFSSLQFQADMGALLAFIFLANMVGAIVLLPALMRWLMFRKEGKSATVQGHKVAA